MSAACGTRVEPKKLTGSDVMTPIKAAVGPLRVSAQNPRYFATPSGDIVYLTGSHTWNTFQDWGSTSPPSPISFNGYVDFLVANGHNFTRVWSWEQASGVPWTSDQVWMSPLPYQRTGPDAALDGQPKFDLTKWNETYFDRLRERMRQLGRRGIYVGVVLFNGLSVTSNLETLGFASTPRSTGYPWRGHPFNGANNVNGIDADANKNGEGEEVHTLRTPAIAELQRAYIDKVLEAIGDQDNVIWEVTTSPLPESNEWRQAMVKHLADAEASLGKVHPVIGGTVVLAETQQRWGVGGTESGVWRTFLSGANPVFMDPYRSVMSDGVPIFPSTESRLQPASSADAWWAVRKSLGYTRWFASRLELETMTPRPELSSTRLCLADPGRDYLIYLPSLERYSWLRNLIRVWPRSVMIDLTGISGTFTTEWFDPSTASLMPGPTVAGGAVRNVASPFGRRGAVLRVTR